MQLPGMPPKGRAEEEEGLDEQGNLPPLPQRQRMLTIAVLALLAVVRCATENK